MAALSNGDTRGMIESAEQEPVRAAGPRTLLGGREPRAAWMTLAACVVVTILSAGTRSSFGAFLQPIEADLHLDRATLSAVGGLTVLAYGLAQPLVGVLATRVGPRWVMAASAVLMALAGFGVATADTAWQLFMFAGLLPGIGFAGASSVPATVLLARWFGKRLGLATGILSSAIPAGQGIFLPFAAVLILALGWRATYVVFGGVLLVLALPALAWLAREPPAYDHVRPRSVAPVRTGADIWLVAAGYFGCGFTDQFVALHFIALGTSAGLDPVVAAGALSALLVIGIVGSVGSGPLADAHPPHLILAGGYLLRAVALPFLLLVGPGLGFGALAVFALLFGVTYISNQAPGSRLVRDRYGVEAVGRLTGTIGLVHQVGGAAGILVGGLSVTLGGGYGPSVLAAAGVALAAGLSQFAIPAAQRGRESPVAPAQS